MLRKIVKYGNPVLEEVCAPVAEEEFGSDELRSLVSDMFETMYHAQGVGLAAPQVGVLKRLTVIDCSGGEGEAQPHVLINPEIVDKGGTQVGREGCLSIPGFTGNVSRPMRVRTRYRTVEGERDEMEGEELLARVICHENDHLNGVLFLRHLSALKRSMIKKKIRALRKQGEWD
jgi:peptide deformylase